MPGRIVSQFWKADWHLSAFLVLLLLVVFVLFPISGRGAFGRVLLQAVFSLILITGATAVSTRRTVRVTTVVLAVATAAIGWIRLYVPEGKLTVLGVSLWTIFFAMLVVVILKRV